MSAQSGNAFVEATAPPTPRRVASAINVTLSFFIMMGFGYVIMIKKQVMSTGALHKEWFAGWGNDNKNEERS